MSVCPCGLPQPYQVCCEPIHLNHAKATKPEQLMRARYAAHVLGLVDFVVDTYHPSCDAESQREGIAQSIDSHWIKLDVLKAESGSHADEGFVTFSAYFEEDSTEYCMTEKSRFVRESGLWYYIDGTFPEQEPEKLEIDPRLSEPVSSLKIGRNDPCLCGSGKKYKKCCG